MVKLIDLVYTGQRGEHGRNAHFARENRGYAQNKPRVAKCVHGMNSHIRKTRNGKVVKRLINADTPEAELGVNFNCFV